MLFMSCIIRPAGIFGVRRADQQLGDSADRILFRKNSAALVLS